MRKLYNNSNETIFIKSLLYNVFLPTYDCVKLGDFAVEGYKYLYQSNIVKCTKTGYVGTEGLNPEYGIAQFEQVMPYQFGQWYRGMSDRFYPKTSIYDLDTHIRFGKYLRYYRATTGIDLLSMYNMYTDNFIKDSKLAFMDNNSLILRDHYKSGFTQLRVPIQFNTTYTIAMDCQTEVLLAPSFFSHDVRTVIKAEKVEDDRDLTNEFNSKYYETSDSEGVTKNFFWKRHFGMCFKQPITYRINLDMLPEEEMREYYKYRNNLYLLIQVPNGFKSPIIILDGDYTDNYIYYSGDHYTILNQEGEEVEILTDGKTVNTNRVVNIPDMFEVNSAQMNDVCKPVPKLLQFGIDSRVCYSDRLTEYLLENIIDNQDALDLNVQAVQNKIPNLSYMDYNAGVWNNLTRYRAYQFGNTQKDSTGLDINGFVDKDTEYAINKQYGIDYSGVLPYSRWRETCFMVTYNTTTLEINYVVPCETIDKANNNQIKVMAHTEQEAARKAEQQLLRW